MTTITIQTQAIQNALNALARRTQNLQPAFDSIGEDLKNNVAMCFRDKQSPDGISWDVLSLVTIAKRRNGSSKILNDTGRLKGSFAHVATKQLCRSDHRCGICRHDELRRNKSAISAFMGRYSPASILSNSNLAAKMGV